jgi:hypothetical protein
MGSGVRVVDLSLYPLTRDTQRTFKLSGPRAQERALLVHYVQAVGDLVTLATVFMMTVSGFVGVVSRVLLSKNTISELFSKKIELDGLCLRLYMETRDEKRLRAVTSKLWQTSIRV